MKKKLLFIIDSLNCGGAEKSLVSLLPLLNPKKYQVFLWMLSATGPFIDLVPPNVKIITELNYSLIESINKFVGQKLFSLMIRVKRIFRIQEHAAETLWKCMGWALKVPDGEWDVVVAYQQGVPTYLAAEKIVAKKKFAWVNADIFAGGYNTTFNARYYRKFDVIVPVSDILKNLMVEKLPEFKDKYEVVYDILNSEVIRELSKEHVTTLRIKDDEYVLVTTARLVKEKGYDIAVKAASMLKQYGVKFRWYFIGEGVERTNIEIWKKDFGVEEEVVLLGLQTNPYAYMAQADIYVQTSKFEGFGLTIGEAKILGKPVVSTNFDVVHNQLTHGQNGLIADMSGESVAENILNLINDCDLKQTLVSAVKTEENSTLISEIIKVETLIDC